MRKIVVLSVLGVGLAAGMLAATTTAWDDGDYRLAVVSWERPDFSPLESLYKDCRLLAHGQDLALLLIPPSIEMPSELADRMQILETVHRDGDYYLVSLADPDQARFSGDARILASHGHTIVVWSGGPPRLTATSRASQPGLVQPALVSMDPKPWPPLEAPVVPEGERARTDFHPLIAQMVSEIQESQYVAKWQALDDYETRYSYTTQNDASAVWMHDVFASYGLQAEYHYFNLSGQRKNVIGVHPGLVDPSRVVYLVGHFDSTSEDPYAHAPGADDNASGSAAFLEAARVLSQYPFNYTIKFVGFSGEEQGLVGSAAYCAYINSQHEDVIGCVNFDMVSYAGVDPFPPDLIIYTNNASLSLARLVEDAVLEFVPTHVDPVVIIEAINASDHASFWQYGYQAICGIEEQAWGTDFCPWYHTAEDRIERYPRDYPTYNTMAAAAAVAQLAIPLNPDTPYLILDATAIDDDPMGNSHGNGNGAIEYGETIELTFTLQNIGIPDAIGVQGRLIADDPYITLPVDQRGFGNIPGSGGTGHNVPPFVMAVDPDVPDDHPIDLRLAINQPPDTIDIALRAYAPDLAVIAYDLDDAAGGDGDGIPEPGEQIELGITVRNGGSVAVAGIWGVLLDAAYIDADPTPISYGDFGSGATLTRGPFRISIDPGCPSLHTAIMNMRLYNGAAYDRLDRFSFNVGDVFADDMESGAGWTHYVGGGGFTDQWHLETYRNHTYGGTRSWKCGGAGAADYNNLLYAVLESSPFVLPESSQLTFWHWIEAEVSGSYPGYCYDGGLVEISIDGGAWQRLTPLGGYPYRIRTGGTPGPFASETPVFSGSHDWAEETFDLSGYVGSARIRFVFGSDGADVMEGWYVDDANLVLAVSAAEESREAVRLQLRPVVPNPSSATATLRLDLPRAERVTVQIVDASGRVVRSLFSGALPTGAHTFAWDGRDGAGHPIGAGIYWARVNAGADLCSARLLRIR